MDLRDLPPRKDPKGGSPKTPLPTSIREASQEDTTHIWTPPLPAYRNGFSSPLVGILAGALVGMTVAWFTALQSHGVSQKEMEEFVRQSQADQERTSLTRNEMHEYVDKFSPWIIDKGTVISRLSSQDQQIGELRAKIDLAAKYIEQQKK